MHFRDWEFPQHYSLPFGRIGSGEADWICLDKSELGCKHQDISYTNWYVVATKQGNMSCQDLCFFYVEWSLSSLPVSSTTSLHIIMRYIQCHHFTTVRRSQALGRRKFISPRFTPNGGFLLTLGDHSTCDMTMVVIRRLEQISAVVYWGSLNSIIDIPSHLIPTSWLDLWLSKLYNSVLYRIHLKCI